MVKLTWQNKVIVASGALFIAYAIFHLISVVLFDHKEEYEPLIISQNKIKGNAIYDPSIEYDATGEKGWLAYSIIDRKEDFPHPRIHIGLGYSTDSGKSWFYADPAFRSKKATLYAKNGTDIVAEGIWRYEVPTLVYDPDDKGKEWKIYAYKYFWDKKGNIDLARKYAAIVYKYSNDPYTAWSKEKWLFSANLAYPPAPYKNLIRLHLNRLHSSLKDISYYSDPGAFYKNGILYIALSAYKNTTNPDRIILIGSADHGKSWIYLSTLLSSQNAKNYGDYTRVNGASIAEQEGRTFLMVSFGNETIQHQGTSIFEFSSLETGVLATDKNGLPQLMKYIPVYKGALSEIGGGQSDYHEFNIKGGIMMPQVSTTKRGSPFKIFKTYKDLLP